MANKWPKMANSRRGRAWLSNVDFAPLRDAIRAKVRGDCGAMDAPPLTEGPERASVEHAERAEALGQKRLDLG